MKHVCDFLICVDRNRYFICYYETIIQTIFILYTIEKKETKISTIFFNIDNGSYLGDCNIHFILKYEQIYDRMCLVNFWLNEHKIDQKIFVMNLISRIWNIIQLRKTNFYKITILQTKVSNLS